MSAKPKAIILMELADKFPDEESARKWFEDRIWPDGERCARGAGAETPAGVTQKTAWFMLHRIREAFSGRRERFEGPVEIDETFVGGRERNKHRRKKRGIRGGTAGKTAVVGAADRETNRTVAKVVENVDADTLTAFVDEHVGPEATVYTDGSSAYRRRENHESVAHSRGEYVRGDCHTNGVDPVGHPEAVPQGDPPLDVAQAPHAEALSDPWWNGEDGR